jgi:hypothetical protein
MSSSAEAHNARFEGGKGINCHPMFVSVSPVVIRVAWQIHFVGAIAL